MAKSESNRPHEIGWAVKQLWNGHRVRRAGWNGKGDECLVLMPGSNDVVREGHPLAAVFPVGVVVAHMPHVVMRTAPGTIVSWHCSQTDLLAIDWEVVED